MKGTGQMLRKAFLIAALFLPVAAQQAPAAGAEGHVTDYSFSFEGPFGTYDRMQLQRGLQVYTEVCAACHGLKHVPIRTLSSESGPGLPEEQVRAYAANLMVEDAGTGAMRPAKPSDNFPAGSFPGAPDLSLMAKARAGFHGPEGLAINQLVKGMGGPEYMASLLAGYTGETKTQAGTTLYENETFPGGWISMPPPMTEGQVSYADGTEATVEQMSKDVSAFLMWTAEPRMMERKHYGFLAVLFLTLFAVLLYLTNKRLWAPLKGRHTA